MKSKIALTTGLIVAALASTSVFAQSAENNANATGTNTNTSGSASTNEGVSATNVFNSGGASTEDMHEHLSGVTGANTAVGLGSFSSSFSSDYCGGTAQAGASVPYVTIALGKPVLGEPGVACVITRTAVHTMEFSATYGTAAAKALALADTERQQATASASKISGAASAAEATNNAELADEAKHAYADALKTANGYAAMSGKLAQASVNMLCNISEQTRKAYQDAGIDCKDESVASK